MRNESLSPPINPVDPSAVWAAAMVNFETARTDEVAYDRTTWRPAYRASGNGGSNIPDSVDSQMELLTDVRCDAEDKLIATPAPNLAGVIWKIEYARKRWEEFEDWPNDWWNSVMSDLARLSIQGRVAA
ncbi:hypothetical protein Sphch_3155 [Sphingobium chlorophenolicum L-1]|uniref:Uncharacterized protein n=1 Tax=Sphingobium chlorophenolicum L-1 TaxID=690566 RepID=F6F2V8_SPHCR|nr:hypothetical protein [Sphingobium chlorophenolicum]AEG50770.1 hypothetical protein Sphch_3155 [Sphingobium chlorophenolicum L-1]